MEPFDFEALLGDKAFDINWIRAELDRRGAAAVIPPKQNRKRAIECDFAIYEGAISSKTSSAISGSSDASQPDTTRLIAALAP